MDIATITTDPWVPTATSELRPVERVGPDRGHDFEATLRPFLADRSPARAERRPTDEADERPDERVSGDSPARVTDAADDEVATDGPVTGEAELEEVPTEGDPVAAVVAATLLAQQAIDAVSLGLGAAALALPVETVAVISGDVPAVAPAVELVSQMIGTASTSSTASSGPESVAAAVAAPAAPVDETESEPILSELPVLESPAGDAPTTAAEAVPAQEQIPTRVEAQRAARVSSDASVQTDAVVAAPPTAEAPADVAAPPDVDHRTAVHAEVEPEPVVAPVATQASVDSGAGAGSSDGEGEQDAGIQPVAATDRPHARAPEVVADGAIDAAAAPEPLTAAPEPVRIEPVATPRDLPTIAGRVTEPTTFRAVAPLTTPEMPSMVTLAAQHLRERGDGTYRLSIRLDPPELGQVHVQLVARGEEVEVVFRVTSPDAGAALSQQRDRVLDALRNEGFQLGGFDVRSGDERGRRHEEARESARRVIDLDQIDLAETPTDNELRL